MYLPELDPKRKGQLPLKRDVGSPERVAELLALMYIQALYLAWFTSEEHFPALDVAERLVYYGIHIDISERDVDRLKKDLRRLVEEKVRRGTSMEEGTCGWPRSEECRAQRA